MSVAVVVGLGQLGRVFASALLRAGVSIVQVETHIPFIGALLKKEQDVDALVRHDTRGGRYPARWADLGPRYNQ